MIRAKSNQLILPWAYKIIFSKYGGMEIKVDGEDYLILSAERDVLAKLVLLRFKYEIKEANINDIQGN
jgi:hypothetical protein